MSFNKTQFMLLLAGVVSTFSAGCITGTNTFSSTAVPETRFCSGDDSLDLLSANIYRRNVVEPQFDRVSLNLE